MKQNQDFHANQITSNYLTNHKA